MSATHGIQQGFVLDHDVTWSLEMTARMFGLPTDTVANIVQIALPMMAKMAETNPELRKRMFAASLAPLPEPTHDFYARMVQSPALRQAAMDDFRATYGTMLDAVNRAAAKQAGTTDGQAREVLAAVLPALTQQLSQANETGTEHGFLECLRALRGA